jgi:hypothetical protein
MHPRIEELIRQLDAAREDLRRTLDEIPRDLRPRSPAEGRWSIAGVLQHLALLEPRLAGMMRMRAAEARAAGVGPETDDSPIVPTLDLHMVLDRTRRIEAPEPLRPGTAVDADEAWSALERAREDLKTAIHEMDGMALSQVRHDHRIFGSLNLYEWIAFVAGHERRHTAQIREIAEQLTV